VERSAEHPGGVSILPEVGQRPPLRSLLTIPVLLTISNYAVVAFLEISNYSLVPLVYTIPTKYGGLGLEPVRMGICLGVFGILNGVLQFALFAPVVKCLGLRGAFVTFVSGLVPAFLLLPINGTHAHYAGTDVVLLALVFFHLLIMVVHRHDVR
jgi:hypothetical protein